MEAYLNSFPPQIIVDGIPHRLLITKNYNKTSDKLVWAVAYEAPDKKWMIYRWNSKLYQALKMMEVWLRQQNFWQEEISNIDFSKLPL